VGTFGIQFFIWVITDDGLQDWCSLCVFGGKRHAPDAYMSVKEQCKALEDACTEVRVMVSQFGRMESRMSTTSRYVPELTSGSKSHHTAWPRYFTS
jgi:hypothetical protein